MKTSAPAPLPAIGPDPDDYCHDCETADALAMEPWCDDPRCRERRRPHGPTLAGGREERGVGRADPEGGGSP